MKDQIIILLDQSVFPNHFKAWNHHCCYLINWLLRDIWICSNHTLCISKLVAKIGSPWSERVMTKENPAHSVFRTSVKTWESNASCFLNYRVAPGHSSLAICDEWPHRRLGLQLHPSVLLICQYSFPSFGTQDTLAVLSTINLNRC